MSRLCLPENKNNITSPSRIQFLTSPSTLESSHSEPKFRLPQVYDPCIWIWLQASCWYKVTTLRIYPWTFNSIRWSFCIFIWNELLIWFNWLAFLFILVLTFCIFVSVGIFGCMWSYSYCSMSSQTFHVSSFSLDMLLLCKNQ